MHEEYELKEEKDEEHREIELPMGIDASNLIGPAIALIILLIIGFFAYNYFIGDIKEVSFSASDLAEKPISKFTVKITDEQGNLAAESKNGEAVKLRKGSYRVSISATGFKPLRNKALELEKDTEFEFEKMEKNISAEILGFDDMPEYFLPEQDLNLTLKIDSESQGTVTLKIEIDKTQNIFESIKDQTISLSPGENQFSVRFKVKNKTAISKMLGKELSGKISLLEASISKEFTFKTTSLEKTDLEIYPEKIEFPELKAGQTESFELSISNKNAIARLENIQIMLEVTNSNKLSKDEAMELIELEPESIPFLEPNSQKAETIKLTVKIPIDAQDQYIKGNVVIKIGGLKDEIKKSFELKIKKAVFSLDLINFPDETIVLEKEANAPYPEKEIKFNLKNSGETSITFISLANSCDPIEAGEWIKSTKYLIDSIDAGKTQEIIFRIAPLTEEEKKINCTLTLRYANPIAPAERIEKTEIYEIELKEKSDTNSGN